MTASGQRKTALYLSSLPNEEQQKLLAALPSEVVRVIRPLISEIVANGWNDDEIIGKVLADEIRGLTAQSSLSVDVIIALAAALPDDWTARLFVANAAVDPKFLLALLDTPHAKRVQFGVAMVPRLPEKLKEAWLSEAADSIAAAA